MTKKLVALACLVTTTGAWAQGSVNFDNTVSSATPPINARVTVQGSGEQLGTGWWAQLYAGPAGSAEGALAPIGVAVQFQVNATTQAPLGQVTGGEVIVPGVAGGAAAVLQMRAWWGAYGANYAAAETAGGGLGIGKSGLITVTLGAPPGTPADLVGLTAFTVTPVPEPATIALGMLGLAALALRRRK